MEEKINYNLKIKELRDDLDKIENFKKINIGILNSYTCNNLVSPFEYELLNLGFNPSIKLGRYNMIVQDLMDKNYEI